MCHDASIVHALISVNIFKQVNIICQMPLAHFSRKSTLNLILRLAHHYYYHLVITTSRPYILALCWRCRPHLHPSCCTTIASARACLSGLRGLWMKQRNNYSVLRYQCSYWGEEIAETLTMRYDSEQLYDRKLITGYHQTYMHPGCDIYGVCVHACFIKDYWDVIFVLI